MKKVMKARCPFCLGKAKKKKGCKHCKGKGNFKVAFAPEDRVSALGVWVDRVLRIIMDVCKVGYPWVSDMSRIGDFTGPWLDEGQDKPTKAQREKADWEIREISNRLGFKVGTSDLIADVAKKFRDP